MSRLSQLGNCGTKVIHGNWERTRENHHYFFEVTILGDFNWNRLTKWLVFVLKSQRNGLEIIFSGGTESTSDDACAHGSSTFGLPHAHLGRVTFLEDSED